MDTYVCMYFKNDSQVKIHDNFTSGDPMSDPKCSP